MNGWPLIVARMCDLRRDNEAAQHKPFLLLWVLAQIQAGRPNWFPYRAVRAALEPVMAGWAPASTPFYPFWHLQSDQLWIVDTAAVVGWGGTGRPPERLLLDADSVGRLRESVFAELMAESGRLPAAAARILETYWATESEREAVRTALRLLIAAGSGAAPAIEGGVEGARQLHLRLEIDRDSRIVADAKVGWAAADARLPCECCQLSFADLYGPRGDGYIQAHHRVPLYRLGPETVLTKVEDLAPVCANCHAMLHREPFMSIGELQSLVLARRAADTGP